MFDSLEISFAILRKHLFVETLEFFAILLFSVHNTVFCFNFTRLREENFEMLLKM